MATETIFSFIVCFTFQLSFVDYMAKLKSNASVINKNKFKLSINNVTINAIFAFIFHELFDTNHLARLGFTSIGVFFMFYNSRATNRERNG
ncbi:hypothetical protein BWP24_28255 (plasmid) [Vibrio campbellii]|nr:hypothetical protein BWP24_28255 [Vibrio campbellii]ARR10510.1 unknow [Vibrio campbellii]